MTILNTLTDISVSCGLICSVVCIQHNHLITEFTLIFKMCQFDPSIPHGPSTIEKLQSNFHICFFLHVKGEGGGGGGGGEGERQR